METGETEFNSPSKKKRSAKYLFKVDEETSTSSSPPKIPLNQVVLEGELQIKTQNLLRKKDWKPRYFRLKYQDLACYLKEKIQLTKRILHLKDAKVAIDDDNSTSDLKVFTVATKEGRIWTLGAPTAEEREKWVCWIQDIINFTAPENETPQSPISSDPKTRLQEEESSDSSEESS